MTTKFIFKKMQYKGSNKFICNAKYKIKYYNIILSAKKKPSIVVIWQVRKVCSDKIK